MDNPLILGCCMVSLTIILAFARRYFHPASLRSLLPAFFVRHFIYPYCLYRHRLAGPWTRWDALLAISYSTIIILCLLLPRPSIDHISRMAGQISLLNTLFLFTPNMMLFSDILGLSLSTYRKLHRLLAVMALLMMCLHIIIEAPHASGSLNGKIDNSFWGILESLFLLLTILSTMSLIQRLAYDFLLRLHQALAVFFLYAAWLHLPTNRNILVLAICLSVITFFGALLYQTWLLFYWSGIWTVRRHCFIEWPCQNDIQEEDSKILPGSDAVMLRLTLPRGIKIDAGQYISLWVPTVGVLASAQLHPYTVVSWAPSEQKTLLLFIKQERGISSKVIKKIRSCTKVPVKIFASILGPFGTVEPVELYDNVLIIATGHGIAAIMSYLKKLMHLYAHPSTRTKRIHFIWQVKVVDMVFLVGQRFLNEVINDDNRTQRYSITISVYVRDGEIESRLGTRGSIHRGPLNCKDIIKLETARMDEAENQRLLVLVSAEAGVRDEIRETIYNLLYHNISLVEHDFQP